MRLMTKHVKRSELDKWLELGWRYSHPIAMGYVVITKAVGR